MCCGSAGTFNIDQPEIANQLGQSKAQAIADSGAEFLVTGNIGCIVQIQNHLQKLGKSNQGHALGRVPVQTFVFGLTNSKFTEWRNENWLPVGIVF